jgi:hypothetical protein
MGLDVFAVRSPEEGLTEEDKLAFKNAAIELCGGMFSGDEGSFRGKLYATLILDLTDISLYDQWIPPETVKQMAEALHRVDLTQFKEDGREDYHTDDFNAETIINLTRFFDVCVQRNLGLAGWW